MLKMKQRPGRFFKDKAKENRESRPAWSVAHEWAPEGE